jgi:hypothetical protein
MKAGLEEMEAAGDVFWTKGTPRIWRPIQKIMTPWRSIRKSLKERPQ